MELTKLIIVALISLSPVGEELIAIPAGVVLGLPVFLAYAKSKNRNKRISNGGEE